MSPARVLAELEAAAAHLGIQVRAEPFAPGLLEGRGGLCWVEGKALVVMDVKMRVPERIAMLSRALAQFDLEGVQLHPIVRETIEAAKKGKRPRARTHPGLARTRPRR
jgi:hypothetical protein